MKFKGSIVIGDPSYFMKSDEDWKKCEFGEKLEQLGFSDFLLIDFPDDPQIVVNEENENVIGGICQDCGRIVVVYADELKKYNADYKEDFFDESNYTEIQDFDGEVTVSVVPFLDEDGYEDEDTVVTGRGNINFISKYED